LSIKIGEKVITTIKPLNNPKLVFKVYSKGNFWEIKFSSKGNLQDFAKFNKKDFTLEIFNDSKPNETINLLINRFNILCDKYTKIKNKKKYFVDFLNQLANKLKLKKGNKIKEDLSNYNIAEFILEEYNIITLKENEEMCIYKNGIYEREKTIDVRKIIKEKCQKYGITYSIHKRNIILEIIKMETLNSLKSFDKNDNILNLKNGLLDLETMKLIEHTPNYLSFRQIQVKYNPQAECPKIIQFFRDIFNENDIDLIFEMIGLSLTPIMIYQKAFLFYGTGNNGKTTFLNLLGNFIGVKNCSDVDLNELYKGFLMSELENRLINFVSDIGTDTELKIRNFKQYVGNELFISVEKKYKNRYKIFPTAKLLYSCNTNFPNIPKETDKGFWRKWIIIECPNTFDEYENPNILNELINYNEFSGLLNFAILGLKELQKRGRFERKYNNWKEIKNLWLGNIQGFEKFITEYGIKGLYESANKNPDCFYWEYPKTVVKEFNKYRNEKLNQPSISQSFLTKYINSSADTSIGTARRLMSKKRELVYTGFYLLEKTQEQKNITEYK